MHEAVNVYKINGFAVSSMVTFGTSRTVGVSV